MHQRRFVEQTAKAWHLPADEVGDLFEWVRLNVVPANRGVVLAKLLRRKYAGNGL